MAVIFRDKDTKEILRIDFGEPISEVYALKEGLENWESEKIKDTEAENLLSSGKGDEPIPQGKSLEERIKALETEVFKK